jgi:hypothetical protein
LSPSSGLLILIGTKDHEGVFHDKGHQGGQYACRG